jgi:hypothetical protein
MELASAVWRTEAEVEAFEEHLRQQRRTKQMADTGTETRTPAVIPPEDIACGSKWGEFCAYDHTCANHRVLATANEIISTALELLREAKAYVRHAPSCPMAWATLSGEKVCTCGYGDWTVEATRLICATGRKNE